MLRLLGLLAGLIGGASCAQFPEFSQQYLQRLSGAVDELGKIVEDFDTSARAAGMSREKALAELDGSEFLARRNEDMSRTIERHTRLAAERGRLAQSTAIQRLLAAPRVVDPEIAERTWADYKPAVPVTGEGLLFGAAGFLAGLLGLHALVSLLRWPFRRRAHA